MNNEFNDKGSLANFLKQAGVFEDDPDLPRILNEIYQKRGQSETARIKYSNIELSLIKVNIQNILRICREFGKRTQLEGTIQFNPNLPEKDRLNLSSEELIKLCNELIDYAMDAKSIAIKFLSQVDDDKTEHYFHEILPMTENAYERKLRLNRELGRKKRIQNEKIKQEKTKKYHQTVT